MGVDALNRAVFLDRDGVVGGPVIRKGKSDPPASLTELQVLPGVAEALAKLKRHGDSWRDVEAGQRAGCTSFFIDRGYDERQPPPHFIRVGALSEAAEKIIAMLSTEVK